MSKSIALAGLIAFLLGLTVFQYYITSVPDLDPPITIGEARLLKEDKSLLVSLVGSEGGNFTIGLRGDIAGKPEETALFYISNPDLVPYVYWPGHRSNDEKKVLELLETWVESQANLKSIDRDERKIAAAYQIYSVLKDRN